MVHDNNRNAEHVIVDIGSEKPRYFNRVRVDIDYGKGTVQISEAEVPHKLIATAHLSRCLIIWEPHPQASGPTTHEV